MVQYDPKERYQPICAGFDANGEIIWTLKPKEPWQTKMFPVPYRGDFNDQWMRLILAENGMEWGDQ